MDRKDEIIKFIDFALTFNVDYVYVLENLKSMVEGNENAFNWNEEDYLD